MKKILLIGSALAAVALYAAPVHASDVGVSFGINVGVPVVPPPPVADVPVYAPPVAIYEPPEFIQPPGLGFYVAAGVPYDLFFIDNVYYLCSGNDWYESPYYNGPWTPVYYRNLPFWLRRYPLERIHYFRDDYYRNYRHAGDWRGYRNFTPTWHGRDWDRRDWNRRDWNGRTGERHWDRRNYVAPRVDPRPARIEQRPARIDPRPAPTFRQPARVHENWGRTVNYRPRTMDNNRHDNVRHDNGNRWQGRGR